MKYGFIGCGNMGGAIAIALAKATTDIAITDRSGKAQAIAQSLGCVYTDIQTVVSTCDRIFLAIKPQMMSEVLIPLQNILAQRKPMLITMAAGLTVSKIEFFAGSAMPVVRIMPNTPVSVGKGMIPYCHNNLVCASDVEDLISDLRFAGKMDHLEEHLMDAATALSGSGPAYAYLFLESLADGAVACGMPREKALEYAAITLAGAAEVAITSNKTATELREAVCSPGGSTIRGIDVLEQQGFRTTIADCVNAAYQRNIELGK